MNTRLSTFVLFSLLLSSFVALESTAANVSERQIIDFCRTVWTMSSSKLSKIAKANKTTPKIIRNSCKTLGYGPEYFKPKPVGCSSDWECEMVTPGGVCAQYGIGNFCFSPHFPHGPVEQ
ncbi:MAG: hypothetical protein M9962_10245 [Oligoflexia bacterium]|nr:hypothetical protein [Oligoflexia bacterium]